jgi:amino acid transporter
MNPEKRYKYSLFSFLIIMGVSVVAFLILFPTHNFLSIYMGVLIFYFALLFVAMTGGIALIISRTTRDWDAKPSFLYNFFGTLNICTGIAGLVLATISDGGDYGLVLLVIVMSFLLGILIYHDIYSKEGAQYP